MITFNPSKNTLVWQREHETLWLQPWGIDSIRIRATRNPEIIDQHWALLDPPQPCSPVVEIQENCAFIRNGKLQAEITTYGGLRFRHATRGTILLEEPPPPLPDNPYVSSRRFKPVAGDLYYAEVGFAAYPNERFFGLGQHQHGLLDQKGCVLELAQRNTEISIPFLLSSRGYGFLWNNPAIGRVELGANHTRWIAQATRQVDYWVTAGDAPAEIVSHYVDATGHPPLLPEWASGFWQCKLRYAGQQELLEVAHEYRRRGLPLSIIVIDALHWTLMGDYQFDPQAWPDPPGMVRELEKMGVKVMVSVWPTINANSLNFSEMQTSGFLVRSERGLPAQTSMVDNQSSGNVFLYLYDPTNPNARKSIWKQIEHGYYRHGIKNFWLDACEPEFYPNDHENLRYWLGNGLEVGNLYPLVHQQAFFDGLSSAGESEIITLSRSAWAGSQRYAAAVWSGDIPSTFEALRAQVPAGLNIGLSGIPWWTTDIGGFHGGDPQSPYFRELIVRWFQYGAFCPIFRLHGFRKPVGQWTGGPNEVWSFGEQAYSCIRELLFLRERLRPYIMEQMRQAHLHGTPPMRPLFFDFPNDTACNTIDDQFMFGADILVAPVLYPATRQRYVYLPAGERWREAWSGQVFPGGAWVDVPAPLERIPLFFRTPVHPVLDQAVIH